MTTTSNGEAMPQIYYPIPNSILEKIPTLFERASHIKKALDFIHFYCKLKVTDSSNVPFLAYHTIHSDKFKPWRSTMGTMVKAKMLDTFFETLPYIPELISKGYRIKFKYLYSDLKLFPIKDIDYDNKIALQPNEDISTFDPETYSFLSKIDFENCTLNNLTFVEDIENRSNINVEGMLLRFVKPNGKVKVKVCSKSKLRLGRSSYSTHDPEKFQFVFNLEKALLLNQKKFYISNIGTKPIEISIDKSGFRLHNNLTNMPSEIVNHIIIEGESVKEVDLKNCHYTLFSNILLDTNHGVFKYVDETLDDKLITISNELTQEKCDNIYRIERFNHPGPEKLSSILTSNFISSLDTDKYEDLALFCQLSFDGLLYEGLSQILWGEISSINRSKAKIVLMEIFYGQSTTTINGLARNCGELKTIFKTYFPSVCMITDGIKNYTYSNWEKVKEYELLKGVKHSVENKRTQNDFQSSKSILPLLLQQVESQIFVDTILPSLRKEGFQVITKHDSILAKESEYNCVKVKMINIIKSTFLENRFRLK